MDTAMPLCIVLIGMPASGKSTIAQALARRLNYSWIDTDHVIEQTHHHTLKELIAAHGIKRFHEIEADACCSIYPDTYESGLVVSTGGSVVYQSRAMAHLKQVGTLVHLDVDLATLTDRIGSLTARGVTIAPGQTFEDLFLERSALYEQYRDLRICSAKATVEETVDAIIQALKASA